MLLPNFDSVEDKEDNQGASDLDLADRLRETWITEVRKHHQMVTGQTSNYSPGPRLDGGIDSHGSTFNSVWPKLAKFVKTNSLNPAVFVKAQFANCHNRPPVSPTVLMGPSAIKRYKQFVSNKESIREIVVARDIQIRQAGDSLNYYKRIFHDTDQAYRAVLLDENIALSALFRYCIAVQLKEFELSQLFLVSSALQFAEDPESYEIAYKDWITDELRQAALTGRTK